jgi:hypothetical protein
MSSLFDSHPILKHLIKILIICVFGVAFILVIYFINTRSIVDACNGSFGIFAILFGIGSWTIIVNFGTFDALNYAFANMISTWHKEGKKKYTDLYTYTELHKAERKTRRFKFVDWYIASAIFLVVAIILEVAYLNFIK